MLRSINWYIGVDVSGQAVGPISQESSRGTGRLYGNVDPYLPMYAASHIRRAKISFTPQLARKITSVSEKFSFPFRAIFV